MSQQITREDVARQETKRWKWRLYGGMLTRSYSSSHGNYTMAMIEGDDNKWPYIVRFDLGKILSGEANDMGQAVQDQYDAVVDHHNAMSEEGPGVLELLNAMFVNGTGEESSPVEESSE